MAGNDVVIVETGVANTASVSAALRRAGLQPVISRERAQIEEAPRLVLPGVGSFGAAADTIDSLEIRHQLRQRIDQGRPTLAVCVGFQLLTTRSEESPDAIGLDILPLTTTRFPDTVRVPQMGWNRIEVTGEPQLLQSGYAYFANSYRAVGEVPGWDVALADYAGPFIAAVERGPVLACQFHLELSGEWGAQLLTRWVERSRQSEVSC